MIRFLRSINGYQAGQRVTLSPETERELIESGDAIRAAEWLTKPAPLHFNPVEMATKEQV